MEFRFRPVLRVVVLCLMVVCFLVQMWEQFDKFLKKQKTVAASFEERNAHKFPTFAFCDSRAYNTKILVAATAARYNETTFDVENEVDLHSICKTDYDCREPSNVTMHMVPTGYNGYCKLYEFHEAYTTGTYAGEILFGQFTEIQIYRGSRYFPAFVIPMDRSYHVFLLEDGEEFYLVTQVFTNVQPSLIVASDTLIYLYNTITKISNQDCEPITAAQLEQCIMEKVEDKIPSLNISCLPFQVQSLFPALLDLYPQCENETEAVEYYKRVSWQSVDGGIKTTLVQNRREVVADVALSINNI